MSTRVLLGGHVTFLKMGGHVTGWVYTSLGCTRHWGIDVIRVYTSLGYRRHSCTRGSEVCASILIAVAMLFALLGTTQKEHYKRRSCNVILHSVMDELEECYKCFSIGPHRCYQNYDATKQFVCKCGNLIFPLALKQNKICCSWCGQDVTDFNHILVCPERKVNSFPDFIRYHCICADIKEKWVL